MFFIVAFVFILLISAGFYIGPYIYSNMVLRRVFRQVADKLDFNFTQATLFHRPRVNGKTGNTTFTINAYYSHTFSRNRKTVVEISAMPLFSSGFNLHIKPESFGSKMNRMMGTYDILIGDTDFDNIMLIKGTELDAVSFLSSRMRSLIFSLALQARNFHFSAKSTSCIFSSWGIEDSFIIRKIRNITNLYSSMKEDKTKQKRLIDNYHEEKKSAVRKRIIQVLAIYFPDQLQTDVILSLATDDVSWQVKIEALRYLGKKGEGRIFELLPQASDEIRIELIKILGTMKIEGADEKLPPVFRNTDSPEIKKEILRTLALQVDPGLNNFLCSLLADSKGDVLQETVNALATCGTTDALQPLLDLKNQVFNPFLKSTIKNTVKKIQFRYAGTGEPGMLSLSENMEEKGNLSLVNEGEGPDHAGSTDVEQE